MAKIKNDKVSFELDLKATKAQEEIHRLTKATEELRRQNSEHRKEISRLAATEGDHSAEIRKLNEQIRANNREIDKNKDAIAEQTATIDLSRKSAAELKKELRNLQKQQDHLSRALNPDKWRDLEQEINRYKEALKRAEAPTVTIGDRLRKFINIGEITKGIFYSIGNEIFKIAKEAVSALVKVVVDFERANSQLAAILGTTADGIKRLTEQAKELGRTTAASASEVTSLQIELAKLGFTQEQIEKMTPSVLKFSHAVGTDLGSAAAFAGAALRIFDRDASQMDETLATLAISTTKSALDFSKLESSMATIGPVANAAGFGLEDTTALLGILANAGFDASSAATATRNIILNLVDTSSELAQGLGRPVKNLQDLSELFVKLEAEGVDLAKALELTDKRSVSAFSTMMKQPQQLMELRESISGVTGEFNAMAETMVDNAHGASLDFESAVEGLLLRFSSLTEAIQWLYQIGTDFVNWIVTIVDAFQSLGVVIGYVATGLGAVVSAVGKLVGLFTGLFTQTKVGKMVLNGLVAALVAYKIETLLSAKALKTFAVGLAQKGIGLVKDKIATIAATIATKGWTAALLSNPFTLVATVLAMFVAGIIDYNEETDEAKEKTDALADANANAKKSYSEQKGKIQELLLVARNEQVSLERRQKAVNELNRIIPGYNAKIDATTKKYTASKEALDAYLASMEKEMRYKAYSDKMQELVTAEAEALMKLDEAYIKVNASKAKGRTNADEMDELRELQNKHVEAQENLKKFRKRFQKELSSGSLLPPAEEDNAATQITADLNNASDSAKTLTSRLKEINNQLKQLYNAAPQNDDELNRIQARIKALQEEKAQILKNHEVRTASDVSQNETLLQTTAPIDEAHQLRVFDIDKRKPNMSDSDYAIEKARETIRYCEELRTALDSLRENTESSQTVILDAIAKRETEISAEISAANVAINKATVQQRTQLHKDLMKSYEAAAETEIKAFEEAADKHEISEEAAELQILNRKCQLHEDQLAELRSYYAEVANASDMSHDDQQKELQRIADLIKTTQSQILTDTGQYQEKLRGLMANTTGLTGIKNAYEAQRLTIESTYALAIEAAGAGTDAAVALEEEKQRRIAALNYEYQEQVWQIQEQIGLSWAEEYERELAALENMHAQGLILEEEYQKARLQLGITNANKYFDLYSQQAGSMFSALQDAEIAMSDAKYDVLIQQAKNNGEDTAALEEEKENKKLEIQKKYADVNFAIKVSQIIADTAVSIMKAYAELGPIAGSISAVMLAATGVAQVAQAKAERDKIKNMEPGRTAGASSKEPAKAQRVLSGYAEGGYTGDGGRYEVAGVVHRGEYVVPKPIMNNPRVVDAVGTIEAIRRNKLIGHGTVPSSTSAGYAEGGYTSATPRFDSSKLEEALKELRVAVKNIRAYVVLRDIEDAQSSRDRARAPFTRKNSH